MASVTILHGDCRDILPTLPERSVQTVITSPPYYGLRRYTDDPREIGQEAQPDCLAWAARLPPCGCCYVCALRAVFAEVKRVLREDGTLWLNLGDSYGRGDRVLWAGDSQRGATDRKAWESYPASAAILPEKNLLGIPWRVALALQADGWILRSDIVWAKGNPMPESVQDRPTRAHEYVFLLAKSKAYYYDADAVAESAVATTNRGGAHKVQELVEAPGARNDGFGDRWQPSGTRNRRSVWAVNTTPYPGSHYAVMPEKLVEPCVLAGSAAQACEQCGAAWKRVVERGESSWERRKGDGDPIRYGLAGNAAQLQRSLSDPEDRATGGFGKPAERIDLGFAPSCACPNNTGGAASVVLQPGDLDIIETPTGERVGEDPSLITGRAGMNRPRGESEGRRPITRYEQRKYAEQLRASPYRSEMAAESGSAFAHYVRTDRSGARPVPPALLEEWIERGWLERVELPEIQQPSGTGRSVVLDPFAGSGTVLKVAMRLGRDAIGIELNNTYIEEHIEKRTNGVQVEMTGLF